MINHYEAGRPAFPYPDASDGGRQSGMDIRTYIATQALNGLLGYGLLECESIWTAQQTVELAVEYADALIAELNKPEAPDVPED